MKKKQRIILILLSILMLLFFTIILLYGPITISLATIKKIIFCDQDVDTVANNIFWQLRFPKATTALLAGAALAVSGLIMQTFFQNPLAGPFVLGIHSGSALGVALWIMATSAISSLIPELFYHFGVTFAAIMGSLVILLLLLFLSIRVPGKIVLLVIGLMFGHLASGIINILIAVSEAQQIKSFLLWTLGSFQRVAGTELIIFIITISAGLFFSLLFIKELNLLLLGDRYAKSSGLSIKKIRFFLIMITAILSGTVTAFCGPIVFLGIVVPHIARGWTRTNDHKILLPTTMMLGGIMALFAEFLSSSWQSINLPLNAIMGLLGAPVLFVFLWQRRRIESL